ncbi:MAG TPA: hypothetical protein VFY29_17980 [Terriglobia bacterium]|nr:hypothetical protein [Terriglobia bacterium]
MAFSTKHPTMVWAALGAARYADCRRTLASAASGQTNDLGEFRLYWLPPGGYLVAVSPRGAPAGSGEPQAPQGEGRLMTVAVAGSGPAAIESFQMIGAGVDASAIFYPGVSNPADAETVYVGVAAEVQRIDVHLRPQQTVTVSGRVVAPFSLAPAGVQRRILQQDSRTPEPDNAGAPELPALPNVQNNTQRNTQGAAAIGSGAALAGSRLALGGGPPIELTLNRTGIAPAGPLGRNTAPVRPDGTFQFDWVTAGSYSLVAIAKDPDGKQHTAQIASPLTPPDGLCA